MDRESLDRLYTFANCKGNTHLFYGEVNERDKNRALREAKAKLICSTCVVIQECRQRAEEVPEAGVWGGLSEEERVIMGYSVAITHQTGLKKRVARERARQSLAQ